MSKFRIGQEVTLKQKDIGNSVNGFGTPIPTPKNRPLFGNVYKVAENDINYNCVLFITLSELSEKDAWEEDLFEAVVSDTVLAEELEQVAEPFTVSR